MSLKLTLLEGFKCKYFLWQEISVGCGESTQGMKGGITYIIKHIIPLCSWSPAPLESPEGDSAEAELWVLLPPQELGHLYMEFCSFSLSITPGHLKVSSTSKHTGRAGAWLPRKYSGEAGLGNSKIPQDRGGHGTHCGHVCILWMKTQNTYRCREAR